MSIMSTRFLLCCRRPATAIARPGNWFSIPPWKNGNEADVAVTLPVAALFGRRAEIATEEGNVDLERRANTKDRPHAWGLFRCDQIQDSAQGHRHLFGALDMCYAVHKSPRANKWNRNSRSQYARVLGSKSVSAVVIAYARRNAELLHNAQNLAAFCQVATLSGSDHYPLKMAGERLRWPHTEMSEPFRPDRRSPTA